CHAFGLGGLAGWKPSKLAGSTPRHQVVDYDVYQNHWRRTGGNGGGMAVRAPGSRRRVVRDAPAPLHSRTPDIRFCRTGVLKFSEVGQREYRSLAAQGRNAARRISVAVYRSP